MCHEYPENLAAQQLQRCAQACAQGEIGSARG